MAGGREGMQGWKGVGRRRPTHGSRKRASRAAAPAGGSQYSSTQLRGAWEKTAVGGTALRLLAALLLPLQLSAPPQHHASRRIVHTGRRAATVKHTC